MALRRMEGCVVKELARVGVRSACSLQPAAWARCLPCLALLAPVHGMAFAAECRIGWQIPSPTSVAKLGSPDSAKPTRLLAVTPIPCPLHCTARIRSQLRANVHVHNDGSKHRVRSLCAMDALYNIVYGRLLLATFSSYSP